MTDREIFIGLGIALLLLIIVSVYFFVAHKDDFPDNEEFRDPTLDITEEEEME